MDEERARNDVRERERGKGKRQTEDKEVRAG